MAQKEKTAIVTGSSRGIAKETAIVLAKKGVNVVICSRSEKEINSAVQEIKKEINDGGRDGQDNNNSSVMGVKCDVSVSYQVDSLIKTTIDKFGSDRRRMGQNNKY
jgi:3-oxoacyl-[acyl-carrier protein] reductase